MALAALASLLIGITLGLLGAGGSILTVPVLHYILNFDAVQSTSMSLFVVGTTASAGALAYARRREIAWKKGAAFALPSLVVVYLARRFLLPIVPQSISFSSIQIHRDTLILVLFSIVMLLAASAMLRRKKTSALAFTEPHLLRIALQGALVGLVTGFVGAGGGFLIVPALVVLIGLEMKIAVGTSLAIIAVNSLTGFLGSLSGGVSIDWNILFAVTGCALLGMLLGNLLARKIESEKLKPAFGWFVLMMGTFILLKETLLK